MHYIIIYMYSTYAQALTEYIRANSRIPVMGGPSGPHTHTQFIYIYIHIYIFII